MIRIAGVFALTGVVPAVCDAEAGERRRSNLTVFQANPPSVQVASRFVKRQPRPSPKMHRDGAQP